VEGDPSTLLGVAREALSSLAPDREPTTNFETLTASIVTPRSTWSFGEEVTVAIYPHGRTSSVDVSSRCVATQIVDHGRNRRNVQLVLNKLVPTESF
jgi:hypothetical protein